VRVRPSPGLILALSCRFVRGGLLLLLLAGVATPAHAQAPRGFPEPAPPDWERPLQSIGSLHTDSDGDFVPDLVGTEVLVAGRVSAGTGLVRADLNEIYIQDGTGGLRLILPPTAEPVLSGDSVLVHGVVGFRYGMAEIISPSVRALNVPSRMLKALPLPNQRHRGGGEGPDLESHEGELVEIRGRVAQVDSVASGHLFVILAGTSLVQVFTYTLRSEPLAFDIAVGDYVRVRGIAIQQDLQPPYNGSYVLYPLAEDDVRLAGLPPSVVRNVALGIGGLFLLAVLWAALLRRQVRRRTQALKVSEARYGHLFEAAADPVFVLDVEHGGLLIEANRAAQRTFGIDADGYRANGRQVLFREIVSDPEAAADHLQQAHDGERALDVLDLLQQDGRTVPFEISSRTLQMGDQAALVSIARNVEERRTYESGLLHAMSAAEDARIAAETARRAAEEAMRLKSTILANMSHEIRTPLTAILGFSDILREEVPPDLVEYAEAVQVGGRRLFNTLNDLVELSRLDADSEALDVEAFDIVDALRTVLSSHSNEATEKGIQLRFASDVDHLQVVHSPDSLRRVAQIVVGNAIKFTDRGGAQVQVLANDGFFAIRVRDSGVGISPAFMPELFEPFKQESDGHSRSFEGTGLGLAIAQRLVARMGGEIRVWSQKGEGSLFEIALPLHAPGAPAPPPVEPRPAPLPSRAVAETAGVDLPLEALA
jgi:PAS domain S-box-containing protein